MTPQEIALVINESPLNRGMDGAAWLAQKGNVAFVSERGDIVLFERSTDGVFEFHWLRSQAAAKETREFTIWAADQMFLDHGAQLLFGLVPKARRDSAMMARIIGAKCLGDTVTPHGVCSVFTLTREMRKG